MAVAETIPDLCAGRHYVVWGESDILASRSWTTPDYNLFAHSDLGLPALNDSASCSSVGTRLSVLERAKNGERLLAV